MKTRLPISGHDPCQVMTVCSGARSQLQVIIFAPFCRAPLSSEAIL